MAILDFLKNKEQAEKAKAPVRKSAKNSAVKKEAKKISAPTTSEKTGAATVAA